MWYIADTAMMPTEDLALSNQNTSVRANSMPTLSSLFRIFFVLPYNYNVIIYNFFVYAFGADK